MEVRKRTQRGFPSHRLIRMMRWCDTDTALLRSLLNGPNVRWFTSNSTLGVANHGTHWNRGTVCTLVIPCLVALVKISQIFWSFEHVLVSLTFFR